MKKRMYSLDLLKFIAAICIVCLHFQQHFPYEGMLIKFYGGKINFQWLVELFFIISGYIVWGGDISCKRTENVRFLPFMGRKILRFWPMHIISLMVYILLDIIHYYMCNEFFIDMPLSLWTVVKNLFLIAVGGVFPFDDTFNLPSWYLCVLILCYILYWGILQMARKLKISPVLLFGFMSLLGTGTVAYGINIPFLNYWSGRGYSAFFGGLVLAELLRYISKKVSNKKILIVCLSIVVGIIVIGIILPSALQYGQNFLFSFIFYPALISLVVTLEGTISLLNHKIWGILGAISFEIYIWHFALFIPIMTIGKYKGILDKINDLTLISVVCYIVLFATFMYFFIERPIKERIFKLMEKQRIA